MNKKFIIAGSIIFIIVVIVVAGVYFSFLKNKKEVYTQYKSEYNLENFKIYLPSSNGLITKQIYFKQEIYELKKVEKIIENFLIDLTSPMKETRILGVYKDKENIVYIDFSKNFSTPQNARDEYLLLKSIYKTLENNFTWIKDIKILIEGREIETLSGHILIEPSLKEALEES